MNILHVDDSQRMISLVKEALSNLNSVGTFESARSFESGKEIINRRGTDIAILEIELPDGNGIDLLKWIKEKCPRTKVVILSNSADICHRAFSKIAGADYFFDKSLEFEKVPSAILEINKINNN